MPKTLRLRADSATDIERAAKILREGGTVAFPTETVYGLGANALDAQAVARIFEAKQRPSWDPLIVHVPSADAISQVTALSVEITGPVDQLAKTFWPGPLTLLLPRNGKVPDAVTAGRPLVGVRVPAHPVAQELLRAAGVPVAAPSANTFGHTSPTTAQHVLDDLDGRIDVVVYGGATTVGVESTVLDPALSPMMLYRPGAVTAEMIRMATGRDVAVFNEATLRREAEPASLPSPGVGIRHYAPRAEVVLVEGGEAGLRRALEGAGVGDGVLLPVGWPDRDDMIVQPWGRWNEPNELAAGLFAGLRSLDEKGARRIFVPLPPEGGINDATRDRLRKAARKE